MASTTSPLHLLLSPSHLLNFLTSSSPQLITSFFHLPLSFFHLLNSRPFHPPINCTHDFLFKSCGEIFFSLLVLPIVLLLFESQKCFFSPLVFLFIFCCCIHLWVLSCMSLWIKLYRIIVMFVVQSENITCHWKFSAHRSGLQLVYIKVEDVAIFLPRDI